MQWIYIPAATSETVQCFAHSHSQKPVRFPAGQSECFHPAKPSFYPSVMTAGITHYTLQAKSCAKWAPFGNPILSECVATLPPKCKISSIGQPVPGADLCRLFAYMAAYCIAHINRSNLSLPYVSCSCSPRTPSLSASPSPYVQ